MAEYPPFTMDPELARETREQLLRDGCALPGRTTLLPSLISSVTMGCSISSLLHLLPLLPLLLLPPAPAPPPAQGHVFALGVPAQTASSTTSCRPR